MTVQQRVDPATPISAPDTERALLHTMLLSREFDRRAALCFRQGGAWFHISSAGHEALGALAGLLRDDDVIAPHYRDRALLLARGMSLADMAHDLLATAGGDARGRNMTSHFSDRANNVFSIASPVASNCLPAAGLAWAARLRGRESVVLCLTGDASTRQGEFYEAVAFAAERTLPVIFLVEDNRYGVSTPTDRTNPRALGLLGADLVVAVDGLDTRALALAAAEAISTARHSGRPRVLWCRMDRLDAHTSGDDQRIYRPPAELAALGDPITLLADRLLAENTLTRADLTVMRAEAVATVAAVFEVAALHPHADPATLGEELFAAPPMVLAAEPPAETMLAAVNAELAVALEDPLTVVFGEDVEDPKGGVFGLTKGLTPTGRVFNSPLAEATIVGVGVGLAAAGLRPAVELQFIDFAGPAWNQLTAQAATLRWRTHGRWICPLIIYAPYGAYLPGGGIWHSQSNESLLTHVPGLRIAVPAGPADVHAVFQQARAGEDPVVVLLPKHLLRQRDNELSCAGDPLLRSGADVTIVAWGNCVELAVAAADELSGDHVGADVVGLCWLDPCDPGPVLESVRRTGRLIVVQEDVAAGSFGASVISAVLSDDTTFYRLLAPPRLLSRAHVHVPYDIGLESAALPCAAEICRVARALSSQE
ncbi:branched-chain alpha-keto acid dehydrogenase [Nocardia panacis]|uniref:Branched-chain alpha-keto acid dehydrogenase n=1 Tax=Nocardia panacis TaxID=2340916 RepID=A0A3A4JP27_9NOCA|nr:alpha-ketoacid dehydrogenase subunit alpha/beta [Nocardia panacis]RJO70738.1 branched-chain alpha-keto acid dehydrogenase [Nocardia panacis]